MHIHLEASRTFSGTPGWDLDVLHTGAMRWFTQRNSLLSQWLRDRRDIKCLRRRVIHYSGFSPLKSHPHSVIAKSDPLSQCLLTQTTKTQTGVNTAHSGCTLRNKTVNKNNNNNNNNNTIITTEKKRLAAEILIFPEGKRILLGWHKRRMIDKNR